MMTSQVTVINPHLYKSVPYDPDKDFVAGHAHRHHAERAGGASVGAGQDRQGAGRADQERARQIHGYAQPGLGTPANLSGELFRLTQKLDLPSIPFGGGGPMIQSVVAGHTPIAFSSMPPAAGQIQAGTLRAARRHRREAHRQPAGRADHGRGRLSRPDRRDAGRHLCAGRHAEGDRRNPAPQAW